MKLFHITKLKSTEYSVTIENFGLTIIVIILIIWGFAVHVADRLIFG